eukprot:2599423-Karenia_brevis.AAC.1
MSRLLVRAPRGAINSKASLGTSPGCQKWQIPSGTQPSVFARWEETRALGPYRASGYSLLNLAQYRSSMGAQGHSL